MLATLHPDHILVHTAILTSMQSCYVMQTFVHNIVVVLTHAVRAYYKHTLFSLAKTAAVCKLTAV